MSFLTTMAMASSAASSASSSSAAVGTAPSFVITGGWGRIGFTSSTRVAAEDGDGEAMNRPTTTNCEVSATSLSTGSYSSRRHFYGGDGDVEENAVSDDDEDDIDSEDDDDSSLEELQPRGGSTVIGIQAWPGRRSLYEDFAGADTTDDGKDEEDDGMDRLAASHMLLSTVFRHGGDGGGGGNHNHNQSNSVVRVVSNDDDDDADDNLKEDEDEAAMAEKWERQLRQNYQKEQQWQRLLAAMGDSTNGNGKGLDLSTIVEEEDDDGSTADHLDDRDPCCSHPTSRNDKRRGVFVGDDALGLDNEGLRWIEAADIGAEKSSAWNVASERDDCEENGGVEPCTDRSTGLMTRTTHRIDSEPQQDAVDRSQLWLQLPAILPRIHAHTQSDHRGIAAGAAQVGVDVGATCEINADGDPPVELLQKTLDCIAALAFYG